MGYLLISHSNYGTRFREIEEPRVPADWQMKPGETAYVVDILDSKRERAL